MSKGTANLLYKIAMALIIFYGDTVWSKGHATNLKRYKSYKTELDECSFGVLEKQVDWRYITGLVGLLAKPA